MILMIVAWVGVKRVGRALLRYKSVRGTIRWYAGVLLLPSHGKLHLITGCNVVLNYEINDPQGGTHDKGN